MRGKAAVRAGTLPAAREARAGRAAVDVAGQRRHSAHKGSKAVGSGAGSAQGLRVRGRAAAAGTARRPGCGAWQALRGCPAGAAARPLPLAQSSGRAPLDCAHDCSHLLTRDLRYHKQTKIMRMSGVSRACLTGGARGAGHELPGRAAAGVAAGGGRRVRRAGGAHARPRPARAVRGRPGHAAGAGPGPPAAGDVWLTTRTECGAVRGRGPCSLRAVARVAPQALSALMPGRARRAGGRAGAVALASVGPCCG